MLSREEKEAKRLLKEQERIARQEKQQDRVYSAEDIYGESFSVEDKLAMITGKDKKKKNNIDLSDSKNDVYIQTPLPYSLAADLIGIKKISNGIIYTTDGRYLKIIEVFPINFLLKGQEEQDSIIYNFHRYLRVAPVKMQIKSIATKTDISDILAEIDKNIANETNEHCIRMQEDYKDLVKRIGMHEGVTRRFFLVVEYERRSSRTETDREIEMTMDQTCNNIETYLKNCGNKVVIPAGKNATNDTVRFIYDILNRDSATKDAFEDRINDVCFYHEQHYGEEALKNISITEYFTPQTVFFGKDYTMINNTYYDFLVLKANGFPVIQYGGWLSLLVNAGDGIDVDLFIQKEDKVKMINRIGRKLRINNSIGEDLNSTNADYDALESEIECGYYLKRNLTSSSEDFYYITIMITISSNSLEGLVYKKNAIKDYMQTKEMFAYDCDYLQKEAFESYLPLCNMNKFLYKRSRRNTLTSGLSSCFPFTSFEMCDSKGILLGTNEMNNSLTIVDIFNTSMFKNANMTIMGVAGSGKSYLLQVLSTRMRRNGIQTFIIAPDKGHEFKRACDSIGGEFITIAPSSQDCVNLMEIRKKDTKSRKLLNMYEEESELAIKIQTLHIAFELLIPDITAEEDQLLDEAIITTYLKYGITFDNKSLLSEDGESYKEMPILGDLYEELIKNPASKRVANIMNRLVNGSARSFNNRTNVDLENKYIVFNLTPLENSPLLPFAMFLMLDTVYSKSKEDITKKKAIVIDEAGQVIGSRSNKKAAEYVAEIFRIFRGYGGAAICATQNYSDFMAIDDGTYGKVILNNSKIKVILNLEAKDAKEVKELLELSNDEYEKIIRFERGHGLLSANGNNVPIHIMASKMEDELFTSDRGQNEKLMERLLEE